MVLKSVLKPTTRLKVVLGLVLLVGIIGVSWWQYKHYLKMEELKLNAEHQRISKMFIESGIAAQKAWAAHGKPVVQEDAMAPQEINDEGELAMAKLWQRLPKDKREILRTETIKSGLEAANKGQELPPN